ALWMAAKANLTHGLPLKSREVRTVFRAYMKAGKNRRNGELQSYREIAQDLGNRVTYTTVRNWMMTDYPHVARQMGWEDRRLNFDAPDVEAVDTMAEAVMQSLDNARAAFRGVEDSDTRQRLLQQARLTLEAME